MGCEPITGEPGTSLTGVVIVADPRLATITVHGTVGFLQLVGVTADELAWMRNTSTAAVLAELAAGNEFLITDPTR